MNTEDGAPTGERVPEHRSRDDFDRVRESLRGLRFGSVNVIVQDGVIVQIDRTEKTRIRRSKSQGPGPESF